MHFRHRYRSNAVLVLALFLAAVAWPARSEDGVVSLDYRPQPDRDQIGEMASNVVTTIRVVEDRGIIAKSNGRLSAAPVTLQIRGKQAAQQRTGRRQPDGSFELTMRYIDKVSTLVHPDGQEQAMPERMPLKGLRLLATIEADGRIREGSLKIEGGDPALHDTLRPTLLSVVQQIASIDPLALTFGKSVPQELTMQLPVPGVATLTIAMHISNQLIAVDNGVARIQQVYSMDFGMPSAPVTIKAEGSGGGTMFYDTKRRVMVSSESGSLIRLVIDAAEGVLEMQVNSRETQKTTLTATDGS
jgi:hypothetical protein